MWNNTLTTTQGGSRGAPEATLSHSPFKTLVHVSLYPTPSFSRSACLTPLLFSPPPPSPSPHPLSRSPSCLSSPRPLSSLFPSPRTTPPLPSAADQDKMPLLQCCLTPTETIWFTRGMVRGRGMVGGGGAAPPRSSHSSVLGPEKLLLSIGQLTSPSRILFLLSRALSAQRERARLGVKVRKRPQLRGFQSLPPWRRFPRRHRVARAPDVPNQDARWCGKTDHFHTLWPWPRPVAVWPGDCCRATSPAGRY